METSYTWTDWPGIFLKISLAAEKRTSVSFFLWSSLPLSNPDSFVCQGASCGRAGTQLACGRFD